MRLTARQPGHRKAFLRYAAAAVLTLSACSCQSLTTHPQELGAPRSEWPADDGAKAASNRASSDAEKADVPEPLAVPDRPPFAPPCPTCPPGFASLPPSAFGSPCGPVGPTRPPIEEYVCNGGDQNVHVQVKRNWTVQGLHDGDTVVHYDTLDGQRRVQPSNEVCLYAPRFAAVRKVYGLVAHEQHDRVAGIEVPLGLEMSTDRGVATTVVQPLQPAREHANTGAQSFRERVRGVGIENAQRPGVAEDQFLPYEDLAIIRRGVFDNSEKARLAARIQAAVAWSHDQALQVLIDNVTAVEDTGTSGPQSTYVYKLPPGKSRLRVVKIASRQNARPGELVEFTIRFDNVGDQTIGNVTVIDRLHDRLEYVADSARCSLPGDFVTEDEDGSPRVLRWEITDPLSVGQGGLIRFTCRVR